MTIDAASNPGTLYLCCTTVGHQLPSDDGVFIHIEAAGACHRDLEAVLGPLTPSPLPHGS